VVNEGANQQPPAQAVVGTMDGGEGQGSLLQRQRVRARAGEDESPAQTLIGGRQTGWGSDGEILDRRRGSVWSCEHFTRV
jgi:hypothetical protein